MKTVDKNAVLVAAVSLLTNNSTTTLDVKNELRKAGYNARQSQISTYMAEISQEEGWNIFDNGTFKTYSVAAIVAAANATVSKTPTTKVKTKAVVLKTKVKGCWEVNSVTRTGIIFVAANATRSQARHAFVKMYSDNYADTRSRKVK